VGALFEFWSNQQLPLRDFTNKRAIWTRVEPRGKGRRVKFFVLRATAIFGWRLIVLNASEERCSGDGEAILLTTIGAHGLEHYWANLLWHGAVHLAMFEIHKTQSQRPVRCFFGCSCWAGSLRRGK